VATRRGPTAPKNLPREVSPEPENSVTGAHVSRAQDARDSAASLLHVDGTSSIELSRHELDALHSFFQVVGSRCLLAKARRPLDVDEFLSPLLAALDSPSSSQDTVEVPSDLS